MPPSFHPTSSSGEEQLLSYFRKRLSRSELIADKISSDWWKETCLGFVLPAASHRWVCRYGGCTVSYPSLEEAVSLGLEMEMEVAMDMGIEASQELDLQWQLVLLSEGALLTAYPRIEWERNLEMLEERAVDRRRVPIALQAIQEGGKLAPIGAMSSEEVDRSLYQRRKRLLLEEEDCHHHSFEEHDDLDSFVLH